MEKALLITVGTGRTREDIAKALAFAIRQHNPSYIMLLATQKSEEETVPLLRKDRDISQIPHGLEHVTDENDFEDILHISHNCIRQLFRIGFSSKQIVADFTSGTKAMSAALCMAATEAEIDALSYIGGKRDEEGRVIPGTERIISVRPGLTFARRQLTIAISNFNKYQFSAANEAVERALEMTAEPSITEPAQWLRTLIEGYAAWDRFELKLALKKLNEAADYPLSEQDKIKPHLERNKQALHQESTKEICPHRGADLMENAHRRAEEGKYDDAVARLYRLLEYLAEYQLHSHNLDPSDLDIEKLPSELQKKYGNPRFRRGEKIELGLKQSYELLADLGDELGKKAKTEEFKAVSGIRNQSILAHGFAPVNGDAYEKYKKLVEDCARALWENLDSLIKDVQFPKIEPSILEAR